MKFKKGDRVRMTATGERISPATPRTGVVVSKPQTSAYVTVRPDGRKSHYVWTAASWEVIE